MIGIYKNVNFNDFVNGFYKINRGEQFTHDALARLYSFYIELSEDLGEPLEFDPIAICCDWAECSEEVYREEQSLCENEDTFKHLEENTQYYVLDNGNILYQQF